MCSVRVQRTFLPARPALRVLAAFFALFALSAATPAAATHVGITLDAGPGLYQLKAADGFADKAFTPLVYHFGVYADGFADGGRENVFEMDMGLLLGGVFNLVSSTDANAEGQDLTQPFAIDDETVRLRIGHLARFRAISAPGELPLGLQWGGNFDVDIGILEVAGAGIQYGGPYVGLGIGPTLAYLPTHDLRVFLSPNLGLHVGDTKDIFTGWSLTGQLDVYYAVIPRYLDVKGQLALDTRTWLADKLPLGPGTIGGISATVGLTGHLGWIFGVDDEDLAHQSASSSGDASGGHGG
jgi:hypothetical protein